MNSMAGTADPRNGLSESGTNFRFASRAFFRNKGFRRVDRITQFNASNGDRLELSRKAFKGIGRLEFESVENLKQLKRANKTTADIIYLESKGRLYFNANSDDSGFGKNGGLFAIIESVPPLSADHFILI